MKGCWGILHYWSDPSDLKIFKFHLVPPKWEKKLFLKDEETEEM